MTISGPSMSDSLAASATGMAADKLMQQLSVSVLKEIQDQQKTQANALIQMMQSGASINGTGTNVNIQV